MNGKKVDIPSYQVRTNDVVGVRPSSKELVGRTLELQGGEVRTDWLALDKEAVSVRISDVPKTAALPFDFQVGMIIEYYS